MRTKTYAVKMTSELVVSRDDLDNWELFSKLSREDKMKVCGFFVFYVHDCGYAALYTTSADEVYGLGWNGNKTNLLGLSGDWYRTDRVEAPLLVEALSKKQIRYFCADEFIGCALDSQGHAYWWGNFNDDTDEDVKKIKLPEQIPTAHKFQQVSCGIQMIAGLTIEGNVYVWGRVYTISEFHNGSLIRLNHRVVSMSCGGHHVAMIAKNGGIYTWGDGSWGQRGYRNYLSCDEHLVRKVLLDNVTSVRCGHWSSFFLTDVGDVWACGNNTTTAGFLGLPEQDTTDDEDKTEITRPTKVKISKPVTELAVAWTSDLSQVAALTATGSVIKWGKTAQILEVIGSTSLITAFVGTTTPREFGLVKVQ